VCFDDSCLVDALQACSLCKLRGGALKRTVSGQWVHIVCILSLPEFRCINIHQKCVMISVAVPAQTKLVNT